MGVISAEYLVFSVNLTAHGSLRPTLNRSDHRKLNFVSVTFLVVTVKPKITCRSDRIITTQICMLMFKTEDLWDFKRALGWPVRLVRF